MIQLPVSVDVHPKSAMSLAYGIASIIQANRRSDDTVVSIRQIMDWYDGYYSKLASEKLEIAEQENMPLPEYLVQTFTCQPVKPYDGCAGGKCNMYRLAIPKVFSFKKRPAVVWVGDANMTMSYVKSTHDTAHVMVGGISRSSRANPKVHWYVLSDYIYLVVPPGTSISSISYSAAIMSPMSALQHKVKVGDKTYQSCDIMTKPLGIPDDMHVDIRRQILSVEAAALMNGLRFADFNNNANPA